MLHINTLSEGERGIEKRAKKSMQCTCYVDTIRRLCTAMDTAELAVCVVYVHREFSSVFWSMEWAVKKWVHLKKLFNYFVWLESSLNSIQSYTHKYTRTLIHWLVYIGCTLHRRPSHRASDWVVYTPYTLISKLGKQIIIFVGYARVLLSKHTHRHTNSFT